MSRSADTGPGLRRVVWVLDRLQAGGAERLALQFAAAAAAGWEVEVVALQPPRPPGPPGPPMDAGPLAQLPDGLAPARFHQFHVRRLLDTGEWRRWLAWLQARRPALVHTHLRYATIWGGTAAQRLELPWLTTVHLGPQPESSRRQAWVGRWEQRLRRRAHRVIYVSEAQRRLWPGAVNAANAVVIPNGVAPVAAGDGAREQARRQLRLPPDAWLITTVAVVRAPKGWRTWLAAAEAILTALPQARMVWVGGGPEWEHLQAARARHGWAERILLAGQQADVTPWLQASDLFLFPSEEEALPTAVLEAMAAGLPIVASDLPAIAEVLGPAGCRVPVGAAPALARAAVDWSAAERGEARRELGEAARARVASHYSESAWRSSIWGLYEQILAERSAAAAAADDRTVRAGRTAAL